ncbi:MAG: molybdopterin-binding protein [Pseudomonadota bacterium]|nr:molybdopterin-binding protein [Pseudomonadota bacterium]
MPTAAAIIIGNEILSGKFADENGPYLIRRLRELGVDLGRIVVLPDVIETIAAEVRSASLAFDHVFTSGGVGPTHDDLTFPAIAAAFDRPLLRHPVLARVLEERAKSPPNTAAYRMAEVPAGAELWWDGNVVYPLVVMRNVAIFPGVPSLFRMKFEAVAHRFAGVPVACQRLVTELGEPDIAQVLTEASERWPTVAIGSYPRFETTPHTVIVTMEGRDASSLAACEAWLRERIPTPTSAASA